MNEMGGPGEVPMPEAAPEVTPETYEAPVEAPEFTSSEPVDSFAETYQSDSALDEMPEAPEVEANGEDGFEEDGVDEMPEAPEVEAPVEEAAPELEMEEAMDEMPEAPPVIEASGEDGVEEDGVDEMPEAPEVQVSGQEAAEQGDSAESVEEASETPVIEANSQEFQEEVKAQGDVEGTSETLEAEPPEPAAPETAGKGATSEEAQSDGLEQSSAPEADGGTELASDAQSQFREVTHHAPELSENGRHILERSTISHEGGQQYENSRATAAGRAADREARDEVAVPGWDGGHLSSAKQGAEPSDTANISPQNAIQNRFGSWKQYETARDADAAEGKIASEDFILGYDPDRPGYGEEIPIYRQAIQHRTDGTTTGENVYYLNSTSSASRRGEELAAQGESFAPGENQALFRQDWENIKEHGNASATEAGRQEQAEWNRLKEDHARSGEMSEAERHELSERLKATTNHG